MYTFNNFCFGHQLAQDKELNNLLNDYDLEFRTTINGKRFEIDFPYHGGQVRNDCYSCIFGTVITDDDQNNLYIDTVRSVKESDYLTDYNQFIMELITSLEVEFENCTEDELDEYQDVVNRLKSFLTNNKPGFYTVEASS